MKRLVYSPKVTCMIMRDSALRGRKPKDIGKIEEFLIDISDDIVSGTVNRRLNSMSDIQLVLQNKNGRYTQTKIIQPMDRIILRMSRVGSPFLVFSGFVDDAPFYQLYPGTVTISASDTLKLLHNTYFDPGLLSMQQWFTKHGWTYDAASGALTTTKNQGLGNLDQYGSMHDLIFAMLTEIAQWPDDAIQIYDLPKSFIKAIGQLFVDVSTESEAAYEESVKLLDALYGGLGSTSGEVPDPGGSTTPGATGSPGNPTGGNASIEQIAEIAKGAGFIGEAAVTAVAIVLAESSGRTNAMNYNSNGTYDVGLWQINTVHTSGGGSGLPAPPGGDFHTMPDDWLAVKSQLAFTVAAYVENCFNPEFNAQQAFSISNHGTSFTPWVTYTSGAYKQYLSDAAAAVNGTASDPGSSPDDNEDPVPQRETLDASIRDKVVSIAKSQLGINDNGNNTGPEVEQYLAYAGQPPGQPWCAAFVQWVFGQAGRPLDESARTASVQSLVDSAKRLGWTTSSPQPGDIIIYDRSGTSHDHTGIVSGVSGGQIYTIEGNSGAGSDSVTAHGPKDPNTPDSYGALPIFLRVPKIGTTSINYTGGPTTQPVATNPISAQVLTPTQIAALGAQGAFYVQQFQAADSTLSQNLSGQRALANDVPIIEWIDTAVQASGRVYCTTPTGKFLSFFPDRWGFFNRRPYFYINDIEIIDLTINKNDTNLVTHVFTSGPNLPFSGITLFDRMHSMIASVEDQGFKYFVGANDPRVPDFDPLEFLAHYGARPYTNDVENINDPLLLWMHGWMKFLEFWSKRYTTSASFTFMPELLPGGLVSFGNRVQMFLESVTHNFSIEGGFTTSAELSSMRGLSLDQDTPDPILNPID